MNEVFDSIIADLARMHAFRNVPGGGPLVDGIRAAHAPRDLTPGRHRTPLQFMEQGRVLHTDDVHWLFRNVFMALRAYMPLEQYKPWLDRYVTEVVQKRPSDDLLDFIFAKTAEVYMTYNRLVSPEMRREPLKKIAFWATLADKPDSRPQRRYTAANVAVMHAVVQKRPALLAAHILLQSGFPEWLTGLGQRIQASTDFTPDQRLAAEDGVMKLMLSANNHEYLMGPALWVTTSYYRRVEGDIKQPIRIEDFCKGWQVALGDGGFNVWTAGDQGPLEIRCPFKGHAAASAEVCAADNGTAQNGLRAWRLFEQLNNSYAPHPVRDFAEIVKLTYKKDWDTEQLPDLLYASRMAKTFGRPYMPHRALG